MLLGIVFAAGVVAAMFETVGVASILPFMALVMDPSALENNDFIMRLAGSVGVTTPRGLLLLMGSATVALVTIGNLAAASNIYVQQRFQAHTECRLRATLFGGYLRQPYAFHVQRDAPSLLKVINIDAPAVVGNAIVAVTVAASRIATVAGVSALLLWQDPFAAAIIAIVLGVAYTAVFWFVRTRQRGLGVEGDRATSGCARISQEGLAAVKELQVLGRVSYPADRFQAHAWEIARSRAKSQLLSQMPRFVLETVAFGGILLVTLVQIASGAESLPRLVPALALYAFAGHRLMPALQQVFGAAANVQYSRPGLRSVYEDYVRIQEHDARTAADASGSADAVRLQDRLSFDHVTFTYPGAPRPALNDLSLTLRRRESIGLVGRTGSGKTTIADLIMGLYQPTSGRITVDGVELTGAAIRAWRRNVGYVSQHVYLSNASVTENVALGVPPDQISAEAVARAIRSAQAHEFVSALPEGYDTIVGERGVKLSGGQRQRLGIARALYHDPEVLVFDEATSALDGLTEEAVMDAVRSLGKERTIVLIAHRLRTVAACDRIVMLERGSVIAEGSYQQLHDTSEAFRDLAGRDLTAAVVEHS